MIIFVTTFRRHLESNSHMFLRTSINHFRTLYKIKRTVHLCDAWREFMGASSAGFYPMREAVSIFGLCSWHFLGRHPVAFRSSTALI